MVFGADLASDIAAERLTPVRVNRTQGRGRRAGQRNGGKLADSVSAAYLNSDCTTLFSV